MKSKSTPLSHSDSFILKYNFKEKKGEGGFGKAFLISDKKDKKEYILKYILIKKKYQNDIGYIKEKTSLFIREIGILKELNKANNPNIIRLIESDEGYIDRIALEGEKKKYLILEYAKKRELFDYIIYGNEGFGETFGKIIFTKKINGLKTIHELGYCHKDLSLSNIFLDENYEPKIGDFGAAMKNENNLKEFISTPGFKPPEVIQEKPHKCQKADIFSLGQILIYIVYGKNGFETADDDPMYELIIDKKEKEYWEKMGKCKGEKIRNQVISEQFKDLYMKMVCPEADKRLTIKEILKHPWVQSVSNIEQKEYENLKNDFKRREPFIIPEIRREIKKMKDDNLPLIIRPPTKSTEEGEINFNSEKEPKIMPDYHNERFCIIFQEYSKNYANSIMNNLYYEIKKKYENKSFIDHDADKFKMVIGFEDETTEIKIKLYQYKNGLILKFFRKEGEKTKFFEKFKDIAGLLLENN